MEAREAMEAMEHLADDKGLCGCAQVLRWRVQPDGGYRAERVAQVPLPFMPPDGPRGPGERHVRRGLET
jgi:hypothetical protein